MMIKKIYGILIIMILGILTGCVSEAYIPTGEIYVKTSPARGDAGEVTVIDMEIEKSKYENSDEALIPVTIGFGHLFQLGADVTVKLIVEVYDSTIENPFFKKEIVIEDYYSEKYSTTEPKNKQFLFIPKYGNFYPKHHEKIEVKIPMSINRGYIRASLVESGVNDIFYSLIYLDLDFNQTNNQITFVIENDRLRQ